MTADHPNNIDQRLEALGNEIDELRLQMRTVREETRFNSQTIAQLQQTILELGSIARLHQQALRVSQQNAEADRAAIRENQTEIRRIQTEIRRIWEYLLQQSGNGRSGQ